MARPPQAVMAHPPQVHHTAVTLCTLGRRVQRPAGPHPTRRRVPTRLSTHPPSSCCERARPGSAPRAGGRGSGVAGGPCPTIAGPSIAAGAAVCAARVGGAPPPPARCCCGARLPLTMRGCHRCRCHPRALQQAEGSSGAPWGAVGGGTGPGSGPAGAPAAAAAAPAGAPAAAAAAVGAAGAPAAAATARGSRAPEPPQASCRSLAGCRRIPATLGHGRASLACCCLDSPPAQAPQPAHQAPHPTRPHERPGSSPSSSSVPLGALGDWGSSSDAKSCDSSCSRRWCRLPSSSASRRPSFRVGLVSSGPDSPSSSAPKQLAPP